MADASELERISNDLQLQQARGEALRSQMAELQSAVFDIASAIEAVSNLKKAKNDALVPVGAGVYISCPKPSQDHVVVSIGASIMVNKKPEEAVKMLEERQKRLNESINGMQNELAAVVRAIDDLSIRASAMAEEERNVRPAKE